MAELGKLFYELGIQAGDTKALDNVEERLDKLKNFKFNFSSNFEALNEATKALENIGKSVNVAEAAWKDFENRLKSLNVSSIDGGIKKGIDDIIAAVNNFKSSGNGGDALRNMLSGAIDLSKNLTTEIGKVRGEILSMNGGSEFGRVFSNSATTWMRDLQTYSTVLDGVIKNIAKGDASPISQDATETALKRIMQISSAIDGLRAEISKPGFISQTSITLPVIPVFDIDKINKDALKGLEGELGKLSVSQAAMEGIYNQVKEHHFDLSNVSLDTSRLSVTDLKSVVTDLEHVRTSLQQIMHGAGMDFSKRAGQDMLPKDFGSTQVEVEKMVQMIKSELEKVVVNIREAHILPEAIQMIENELKKVQLTLENVKVGSVDASGAAVNGALNAGTQKAQDIVGLNPEQINAIVGSLDKMHSSIADISKLLGPIANDHIDNIQTKMLALAPATQKVKDAIVEMKTALDGAVVAPALAKQITDAAGRMSSTGYIKEIVKGIGEQGDVFKWDATATQMKAGLERVLPLVERYRTVFDEFLNKYSEVKLSPDNAGSTAFANMVSQIEKHMDRLQQIYSDGEKALDHFAKKQNEAGKESASAALTDPKGGFEKLITDCERLTQVLPVFDTFVDKARQLDKFKNSVEGGIDISKNSVGLDPAQLERILAILTEIKDVIANINLGNVGKIGIGNVEGLDSFVASIQNVANQVAESVAKINEAIENIGKSNGGGKKKVAQEVVDELAGLPAVIQKTTTEIGGVDYNLFANFFASLKEQASKLGGEFKNAFSGSTSWFEGIFNERDGQKFLFKMNEAMIKLGDLRQKSNLGLFEGNEVNTAISKLEELWRVMNTLLITAQQMGSTHALKEFVANPMQYNTVMQEVNALLGSQRNQNAAEAQLEQERKHIEDGYQNLINTVRRKENELRSAMEKNGTTPELNAVLERYVAYRKELESSVNDTVKKNQLLADSATKLADLQNQQRMAGNWDAADANAARDAAEIEKQAKKSKDVVDQQLGEIQRSLEKYKLEWSKVSGQTEVTVNTAPAIAKIDELLIKLQEYVNLVSKGEVIDIVSVRNQMNTGRGAAEDLFKNALNQAMSEAKLLEAQRRLGAINSSPLGTIDDSAIKGKIADIEQHLAKVSDVASAVNIEFGRIGASIGASEAVANIKQIITEYERLYNERKKLLESADERKSSGNVRGAEAREREASLLTPKINDELAKLEEIKKSYLNVLNEIEPIAVKAKESLAAIGADTSGLERWINMISSLRKEVENGVNANASYSDLLRTFNIIDKLPGYIGSAVGSSGVGAKELNTLNAELAAIYDNNARVEALTQRIATLKNEIVELDAEMVRLNAKSAAGIAVSDTERDNLLSQRKQKMEELANLQDTLANREKAEAAAAKQAATEKAKQDKEDEANKQKAVKNQEKLNNLIAQTENRVKELNNIRDNRVANGKQVENLERQIALYNRILQYAREIAASGNSNRIAQALEHSSGILRDMRTRTANATRDDNTASSANAWVNATNAQKGFESQTMQTLRSVTSLDQQFSMLAMNIQNAFSIIGLQQFADKIIEIGGELERQQLAMGSIFQDQRKADAIYKQVADLSMKSPFDVQDLVKNTKQLSAFGIEYEELYDTTKRLSDIAAGVGVEFGRIAYEYGQMESMGYLDARHLRMFSMSGIPLLQKLQEYYSQLKDQEVGVEEIRKMIFKKQIDAETIKSILRDMTNEGGAFYNMQEVMAESLASKWRNFGNAKNLMYGDIAQGSAGEWLKDLAEVLTGMAENWEDVARAITVFTVAMASAKAITAGYAVVKQTAAVAEAKSLLISKGVTAARAQELAISMKLNEQQLKALVTSGQLTAAQGVAAVATSGLTREKKIAMLVNMGLTASEAEYVVGTNTATAATARFRYALVSLNKWAMSNIWFLLAAAIAAVGAACWNAYADAHKLENELKDLEDTMMNNLATETASIDALINKLRDETATTEELERAKDEAFSKYGEYFTNLDREASSYDEVANAAERAKVAIENKMRAQLQSDKIEAINENYGEKIDDARDDVRTYLKKGLKNIGKGEYFDVVLQEMEKMILQGYNDDYIEKSIRSMIGSDKFNIKYLTHIIEDYQLGTTTAYGWAEFRRLIESRNSAIQNVYDTDGHLPFQEVINGIEKAFETYKKNATNEYQRTEIDKAMNDFIVQVLTGKTDTLYQRVNASGSLIYKSRGFGLAEKEAQKYIKKSAKAATQLAEEWRMESSSALEKYETGVRSSLKPGSDDEMSTYFKKLYESRKKAKEELEVLQKEESDLKAGGYNPELDMNLQKQIKERKDIIEAVDEIENTLNQDFDKLFDKKTKTSNSKEDKELKAERERLTNLKKLYDEYNKVLSTSNSELEAISRFTEGEAGDRFRRAFGDLKVDDLADFRKNFLNELQNGYDRIKNDPKLKEIASQYADSISQFDNDQISKDVTKSIDAFKRSFEEELENWDFFKQLVDSGMSSDKAFELSFGKIKFKFSDANYDEGMRNALKDGSAGLSEYLKAYLTSIIPDEVLSEKLGGDILSLLGMSKESLADLLSVGKDSSYVAQVLEVVNALDKVYKDERSTSKSAIAATIDALPESVKYQMKLNKIQAEYNKNLKYAADEQSKNLLLIKKTADEFDAMMEHWKANPVNTFMLGNLSMMNSTQLASFRSAIQSQFASYEANGKIDPAKLKEYREMLRSIDTESMSRSFVVNVTKYAKKAQDALAPTKKLVEEQQKLNDLRAELNDAQDSGIATKEQIASLTQAITEQEQVVVECEENVENTANDAADALENLKAAIEQVKNNFQQIGGILSNIGGAINDDFGKAVSQLGSTVSSAGSIMDSVSKGGWNAISGYIQAVIEVYNMSQTFSDIVSDYSNSFYEKAAEKQKSINDMAEAVWEYDRALMESAQHERNWFSTSSFGGIQDSVEKANKAFELYQARMNEYQATYQEKVGTGWGKYFTAGLVTLAAVAVAVFTEGIGSAPAYSMAAAAWGAALGTAAAGVVDGVIAGAEVGLEALAARNGLTRAIDNIRIITVHKKNGWNGRDEQTISLQQFIDQVNLVQQAFAKTKNVIGYSKDEYDKFAKQVTNGKITKEIQKFAEELYYAGITNLSLFDENGMFNTDLIDALQNNESISKRLAGESPEALNMINEAAKAYKEAFDEMKGYVSEMFSPLIDNMTDAMWDWFDEGKDAMDSFKDYASSTFRNIATELMKTILTKTVFTKFGDEIANVMLAYGNTGDYEWMISQVGLLTGDLANQLTTQVPVLQNVLKILDEKLKEAGYANGLSDVTGGDSSSIKDSFANLLKDINSTIDDFMIDFYKSLSEKLIDRMLDDDGYNESLKNLETRVQTLVDNSASMSDSEIEREIKSIADDYEALSERGLAAVETLYKATGQWTDYFTEKIMGISFESLKDNLTSALDSSKKAMDSLLEDLRTNIATTALKSLMESSGFNGELEKFSMQVSASIQNGTFDKTAFENGYSGILDWLSQLIEEINQRFGTGVEEALERFTHISLDSFLDNIASSMGDASKSVKEMMEDMRQSMLEASLTNWMDAGGDNSINKRLERWRELWAEAEKNGTLAEQMDYLMSLYEQIMREIEAKGDEFADQYGVTKNRGGSLTAGIKSITEETADILAAYVNGIRQDTSVIRYLMEQMVGSLDIISGEGMYASIPMETSPAAYLPTSSAGGVFDFSTDIIETTISNIQSDIMDIAATQLPQLSVTASAQLHQLQQQTEYLRQINDASAVMQEGITSMNSYMRGIATGSYSVRIK